MSEVTDVIDGFVCQVNFPRLLNNNELLALIYGSPSEDDHSNNKYLVGGILRYPIL